MPSSTLLALEFVSAASSGLRTNLMPVAIEILPVRLPSPRRHGLGFTGAPFICVDARKAFVLQAWPKVRPLPIFHGMPKLLPVSEPKRSLEKRGSGLDVFPGYLIRRLHQISVGHFTRMVLEDGFDLTPVQFAALQVIVDQPGLDQITVAGLISYDRVTIGGVIDRLERKKLIVRRISKTDRRARELFPTRQGQNALSKIRTIVARSQKEILRNLTDDEEIEFVRLLRKVIGD